MKLRSFSASRDAEKLRRKKEAARRRRAEQLAAVVFMAEQRKSRVQLEVEEKLSSLRFDEEAREA